MAEFSLGSQYNRVNILIVDKTSISSRQMQKLTSEMIQKQLQYGSKYPIHHVVQAKNEVNLINKSIQMFQDIDPDIVIGYETEGQSIGYLCKRGDHIGIQTQSLISRVPHTFKELNEHYFNQRLIQETKFKKGADEKQGNPLESKRNLGYFQAKFGKDVKLVGRVVINLWRVIKHEMNLTNYDLDNVCFHVLKSRQPKFSYDTLSEWWMKGLYYNVSNYILQRINSIYDIVDSLDLINRDMNMAKVYGFDYESIMTRGSQFRVEAILSRISKSSDYLLLTASTQQVRNQNELEVIPLVIEPEKAFYTSPVAIMDFQSLYPSVIIAYNICYSTCLGKITKLKETSEDQDGQQLRKLGVYLIPPNIKELFGFKSSQKLTSEEENYILDNILIAPNLNCFVKPHIREGLLPKMCREILFTRIMVKKSLKFHQKGSLIYKMLDSRQLALKLIANVTYGYTGAGFSGRMPCSEIADSVVSYARQTLEKSIERVNQLEDELGTRVVYGDTDSIFILCEGKSVEQTFKIGEKLASLITVANPYPMELKFEKVYFPMVTLAKKRYCGYKIEKLNEKPVLDAKGIETIRRDTVDAVSKIMDKCLRLLFETKDLSLIKQYLFKQWHKIASGEINIKDFIFAKEVRYGTYRTPPLSSIVCDRRIQIDPANIPKFKERIPYVIAMAQGGAIDSGKLKDLVLSPEEFIRAGLEGKGLLLNSQFYIKKHINASLNRIFKTIFEVDVNLWFDKMPKKTVKDQSSSHQSHFGRLQSKSKSRLGQARNGTSSVSSSSSVQSGNYSKMLDTFYHKKSCIICGSSELLSPYCEGLLCRDCQRNGRESNFILLSRLKEVEFQLQNGNLTCLACSGMNIGKRVADLVDIEECDQKFNTVGCESFTCRVMYENLSFKKEWNWLNYVISKCKLD